MAPKVAYGKIPESSRQADEESVSSVTVIKVIEKRIHSLKVKTILGKMNNMKYQGADQPVARKHIQDSRKI
jgi:hypothetical protein